MRPAVFGAVVAYPKVKSQVGNFRYRCLNRNREPCNTNRVRERLPQKGLHARTLRI